MAVQPGLCRTWSEDRFSPNEAHLIQGVQRRIVLVVNFFYIFEIIFFFFVVAIFDLVQDVEAIFTFLKC